jgi:Short C-terminal domain
MMMRRGMRRTARRTSRRVARRTMRRRMMIGGMVVIAAAGTAAAVKMSKQDAQRIEEHTGLPPEQLEDQDLQDAMQDLGIQGQPVTAEDQAALAGAPAPAAPAQQAPAAAPQQDYLKELERLADLRDRGILTDEEFQAKKKQLLGL